MEGPTSALDQLRHQAGDHDADGDNDEIPPDLDVPTPAQDQTYPDFESLRHAINAWSLRDGFIARCSKKDTSRAQYRCRYFKDGCHWAVRATVARATGLLTVTSVIHDHTCSPPDIWINHEGIEQKGKRAVHATQRWVVETLNRLNYKPLVTTAPMEIVDVIQDRCGMTITENLALKARDKVLLSLGMQPPLPYGRGGRPDQVQRRKRMREAEAAMTQQRTQERMSRELEEEEDSVERELDITADSLMNPDEPFVFESGFRVLGPIGQSGPIHGGFVRPRMPTDASIGRSSMSATPSAPTTRTCHTCGGCGVVPILSPTMNGGARASGAAPGLSAPVSYPGDEELSLLKQQVGLIMKQIDMMQKRRGGP